MLKPSESYSSFDSQTSIEAGLLKVHEGVDRGSVSSTDIVAERAKVANLFYKMRKKWDELKRGKSQEDAVEKMVSKNLFQYTHGLRLSASEITVK